MQGRMQGSTRLNLAGEEEEEEEEEEGLPRWDPGYGDGCIVASCWAVGGGCGLLLQYGCM